MGIPTIYNWLTAKYPRVVVLAPPVCLNSYDNLYLDVTHIIYQVLHPVDRPSPVTTDQAFQALYEHIDRIFKMVRPRRLAYMAIDGVAPRAKMNKQRSSRFRAAKAASDADVEENKLREKFEKEGKRLPAKNYMGVYFSHLVAPGTRFMVDLSTALKHYVQHKLNHDPEWKNIKVIVSDANVPGEGEHKIMSYVRLQRNSPEYDANARHCVYGSDADLIMLGLATHELHYSILRNVPCTGDGEAEDDDEYGPIITNTYQFLHLWKFREYFKEEITTPESKFVGDFERRIDDFVFMCFFLGNDFLPNIPSLVISEGAVNLLLSVYKKLVDLGEYLTDSGKPNLKNLERFIQAVGFYEDKIFKIRSEEYKAQLEEIKCEDSSQSSCQNLLARSYPRPFSMGKMDSFKNQMYENKKELKKKLKELLLRRSDTFTAGYNRKEDKVKLGETGWKDRYYREKFLAQTVKEIEVVKKEAVLKYMEGLCWLMHYYYKGVGSWKWHYPYHYAPFASDFKDLGCRRISFELGSPFKPFTQMLGISPASNSLPLPKEYRKLITDPNSPIKDFYPVDFEIDTTGKRYTWEGIVNLPFVDEKRLLAEVAKVEDSLTAEDVLLNSTTSDIVLVSSVKS